MLLVPVFRLNSALCILAPGPTAGAKKFQATASEGLFRHSVEEALFACDSCLSAWHNRWHRSRSAAHPSDRPTPSRVPSLRLSLAPTLAVEAAAYEAWCAQTAIDTIRHALSLRDREQARGPLREAAIRLGVTLDETDEDWTRLAHRALRVMLNAAEENARRDVGVYDTPSPFFRSARGQNAMERPLVPSNPALMFAPPAFHPAPPQPVACPPCCAAPGRSSGSWRDSTGACRAGRSAAFF